VIFPFEPAVYAGTRVPVEYVGHPLVERVARVIAGVDRDGARRELRLPANARIVALLPGSRGSEMRHLLPLQLEVARVLHARDPRIHFVMPRAASLARETLEKGIRAARLPSLLQIDILQGRSHVALRAADVALLKPGTSTLEAALLDCPLVVAARTNRLTAWILRRLVRVDTLTMPNLIAGEPIVPEFLQEEARPEAIADAVLALLEGPARDAQRARLAVVRQALAKGGAAVRAAELAAKMIRGGRLPA
jgi:lipid-A-disaccharide synthase